MRCPFCQARIEADDVFCMKCEQELPTADSPADTPAASTTPPVVAAPPAESSHPDHDEPIDSAHGWVVPFVSPRLLPAPQEQFKVRACPYCQADATHFTADGTCDECFKQAVRSQRDDFYIQVVDNEMDAPAAYVAARSHLGKKHGRNEDFADVGVVMTGDKRISFVVVCDGVSQCTNPQEASVAASQAAGAVLRQAALEDRPGSETLLKEALSSAQNAVCQVKAEPGAREGYGPPACTITAIYVREGEAFYGWSGDSRIYSIDKRNGELKVRLLSRDHTFLNWVLSLVESRKANCPMAKAAAEIVDNDVERAEKYLGLRYQAALTAGDTDTLVMLKEDVEVIDGPGGLVHIKTSSLHTMEQCLGGEIPEGFVFSPSTGRFALDNNVCLFACSDGAWNDADPMDGTDASEFANMFTASGGSALDFACATVNFASGADNNTCAVILS